MCTAMTLQSVGGAGYLGRTLDFSFPLEPHFYCIARGHTWSSAGGATLRDLYSFVAIGQQLDGVLAFFDGVNEHGFAAAALYFAGYAQYDTPSNRPGPPQVAAYDFLHYILGTCASVEDFCAQAGRTRIVGVPDPLTQTAAPLHWIATDTTGACVVLEKTQRGSELLANPLGVLANSPDLRWHMTNLQNYMQASPHQVEEAVWGNVRLVPFGQAGGTVPLPGGYTSPERFVRTAYLKTHLPVLHGPDDAVRSFFQVMKSVSIPKGAVLSARGTFDYTQYTACIDLSRRAYSFSTYDNLQIRTVPFPSLTCTPDAVGDLGRLEKPMVYGTL